MTEYEAAKEVIKEMYDTAKETYRTAVEELADANERGDEEDMQFYKDARMAAAVRRHTLGVLVKQLDMRVEYKMSGMDWDRKE